MVKQKPNEEKVERSQEQALKVSSSFAPQLWKVLLLEEAEWRVHRNSLNYFCNPCVSLNVFERRHLKKWFKAVSRRVASKCHWEVSEGEDLELSVLCGHHWLYQEQWHGMVRTKVWCECFQGRMGSDHVRTRSRDNSLEEFYYGVQRNTVVDRSVNRARRIAWNIVESWTSCHFNPYISLATAFCCDTFNDFALIVLHFLLPLMILLFIFFHYHCSCL